MTTQNGGHEQTSEASLFNNNKDFFCFEIMTTATRSIIFLLFSNSLLYLILLVYSFKIGELLKFSRIEHYFLFLLIIFNPHLEYFSFQLIPDLFRTTIFILLILVLASCANIKDKMPKRKACTGENNTLADLI